MISIIIIEYSGKAGVQQWILETCCRVDKRDIGPAVTLGLNYTIQTYGQRPLDKFRVFKSYLKVFFSFAYGCLTIWRVCLIYRKTNARGWSL